VQVRLQVGYADTVAIVEIANVDPMLMLVSTNNAIGGVACPSAVCVMHDDDILNPEEMLRDEFPNTAGKFM